MKKISFYLEVIVIITICVIVTKGVLSHLSLEKGSLAEFIAYIAIWICTFCVCSLVFGFGKKFYNRIMNYYKYHE